MIACGTAQDENAARAWNDEAMRWRIAAERADLIICIAHLSFTQLAEVRRLVQSFEVGPER